MDIKAKQLRGVGNLAKSAIKPKPQYKGHIIKKEREKNRSFSLFFRAHEGTRTPTSHDTRS